MVKVYSISECSKCDEVKSYLASKGITFESIDVRENMEARKEMTSLTKAMSVPVTYIGGSYVIGFEREQLDQLLKNNNLF